MKVTETIRRGVEGLLTAPGEKLGRWARFLRFQIQLWRFCGRRLREHNAMAMSSALSFRTLFALIPTLVLALLVMKPLGLVRQGKQGLRELLVRTGIETIAVGRPATGSAPATGPATVSAADEIVALVTRVEQKLTFGTVGPVGVVLLIWSALTLLSTVEGSLNRIFGATRSRALGRRVLLYWSAVTFAPVLLAATAYVGGKAAEAARNVPALSWMLAGVNWAGPAVVGIVLLAVLYKLMPNTHVRYRAALGAAGVAVPLWLLAKWAFGLYVTKLVVGQGSLYGALGLLPLFLLWLNLSWTIFLFGAELAATAANLKRMASAELAESIMLGPSDLLAAALAVGRPYQAGHGAVSFEQVAAALDLPDASVRRLLDRLSAAGAVVQVESGRGASYVLAQPADRVRLADLMAWGHSGGPAARAAASAGDIAQAVAQVQRQQRQALGDMTLADAIAQSGRER